jgi:hypothetical protein
MWGKGVGEGAVAENYSIGLLAYFDKVLWHLENLLTFWAKKPLQSAVWTGHEILEQWAD